MITTTPLKPLLKQHWLEQSSKLIYLLVAMACMVSISSVSAWSNRVTSASHSVLAGYQLAGNPHVIEGIEDNASGITHQPSSDTLFMIVNNPAKIVELSLDGEVIREIVLRGFVDTEGIAHVKDQLFAVLEERRAEISLVSIDSDTREINKSETSSFALNIFPGSDKNLRLEGISADHQSGDIYVVKEKSPKAIYKIQGLLEGNTSVSVSMPWDIEAFSDGLDDLSGIFFEPASQRLLILSDESRRLSEFTPAGKSVSHLKLKTSRGLLARHIPQAEGITLTRDGSLYVVSEPNLLYRYEPGVRRSPERNSRHRVARF